MSPSIDSYVRNDFIFDSMYLCIIDTRMSSYKINLHISVYYVCTVVLITCVLREACMLYSYGDE